MMAARKLFGTDGVRGPVGELLTPELALQLGRAATLEAAAERPQVLIVRDTRESGPMLSAALAAGVAAGGGDAHVGGVLPTPAASILVRRHSLDLAAAISASHNPWRDNGIKLFGPAGRKLSDDVEERIEARVGKPDVDVRGVGRIGELHGALDDYLRELEGAFRPDLSGRRVVLDCANGATHRVAPIAFERLGAEVETIGDEPDGRNINEDCGSTQIGSLVERVRSADAGIGFAFDGDGDRVLAVDGSGTVRDGDELIALIALHLQRKGEMDGRGAAVTVMTNYAFHRAMADAGIDVATTKVGDRHVIDELLRRGWTIGGEQSGHVIWTEFAPTGDGVAAALLVLEALGGRELAEAVPFEKLPQELESVRVRDPDAISGARALWDAVGRESAALEGRGRVLVRPSGTEPLLRIMVEAPSADECRTVLDRLTEVARRELGAT